MCKSIFLYLDKISRHQFVTFLAIIHKEKMVELLVGLIQAERELNRARLLPLKKMDLGEGGKGND